jgi:hypothetical protein
VAFSGIRIERKMTRSTTEASTATTRCATTSSAQRRARRPGSGTAPDASRRLARRPSTRGPAKPSSAGVSVSATSNATRTAIAMPIGEELDEAGSGASAEEASTWSPASRACRIAVAMPSFVVSDAFSEERVTGT